MNSRSKGFTLIELLIVVAIIGILAAIAIPNFLEAQTRAKVARIQSELRLFGTSLELFYVDNNSYPVSRCAYMKRNNIPSPSGTSIALLQLTTPIAYITSIPMDIFSVPEPTTIAINVKMDDWNSWCDNNGLQEHNVDYIAWSRGPDGVNNIGGYRTLNDILNDEANGSTVAWCGPRYDPTNGTISAGDIVLLGLREKESQGYYSGPY